jgi:Fur family peroxide stress response transcriptional regulator
MRSIFREKNLKVTPQRYAIYKYLCSTKEHPSAETIYNELKEEYPMLSLATVYKTLRTLVDIGIVQELNAGEDNFRYDANAETHPHIMCLNCGRVDDIEGADFSFLNELAARNTDYTIESHKLYFYGICRKCKRSS